MNAFKIIAFTHKTADLKNIGDLHIDDVSQQDRLTSLKHSSNLQELLFLSTCNRVEFLFSTSELITEEFTASFIQAAYPHFTTTEVSQLAAGCLKFEGKEAMRHLLQVASSIDSLVVGEREIITQVRNAYDKSLSMKLTGDLLRLVIKRAIETAKQVYTETQIAHKPVSIVSLAYRKLKDLNVKLDARFVIIGAGQTNQLMAKFLKKHGFTNFVVFNRTLANGEKLAIDLNGKAYSLTELKQYSGGFDVILTCTASAEHIIDAGIYSTLTRGEKGKKIIIDLSIPTDIEPSVISDNKPYYIDITALQAMASENLKERHKELEACNVIIEQNIETFRGVLKERKVELAMSAIPQQVKDIHSTALNTVFAKEMEKLDAESKQVLEKILSYVEKKYISVPMKMAKEILIEN